MDPAARPAAVNDCQLTSKRPRLLDGTISLNSTGTIEALPPIPSPSMTLVLVDLSKLVSRGLNFATGV